MQRTAGGNFPTQNPVSAYGCLERRIVEPCRQRVGNEYQIILAAAEVNELVAVNKVAAVTIAAAAAAAARRNQYLVAVIATCGNILTAGKSARNGAYFRQGIAVRNRRRRQP